MMGGFKTTKCGQVQVSHGSRRRKEAAAMLPAAIVFLNGVGGMLLVAPEAVRRLDRLLLLFFVDAEEEILKLRVFQTCPTR